MIRDGGLRLLLRVTSSLRPRLAAYVACLVRLSSADEVDLVQSAKTAGAVQLLDRGARHCIEEYNHARVNYFKAQHKCRGSSQVGMSTRQVHAFADRQATPQFARCGRDHSRWCEKQPRGTRT